MHIYGIILLLLLVSLLGTGYIYLARRLLRCSVFGASGKKGRVSAYVLPMIIALIAYLLGAGFVNILIVFLHLIVFMSVCDAVGFIIKKATKKEFKRYYAGAVGVVLTVCYLGCGWFFAHHVFRTGYEFTTEKDIGAPIRIALIADAHLSTTLDGEEFAEELTRIEAEEVDVLVITGDFVDDETEKEDMLTACEALGKIKTEYGVYFVFGNHDEGYFNYRSFTGAELYDALEQNGVTVLEDESVLIDDRFYIVGRKDRSDRDRAEISELVSGLDSTKYAVVLNHQPNDYAAEAESGVDLVLSGHTHGGHIFPAGIIGVLIGSNDLAYGTERRGSTDFVVTSGISGWEIPFKTGAVSEYVVIDIK